jgi:hypothetical protein
MKRFLLLFGCVCLVVIGLSYLHIEKRVTKFDLPKGELKWSNVKPQRAKMCIPAAFTYKNGNIQGSYRIDGKTYQRSSMRLMKVSLKGDKFFISRNWMSDNGFQQLALVCDSKQMKFYGADKSMRRALCKDENGAFILESNYPMTLASFAYYCSKYSSNAVYLDMGEYGYGYIKKGWFVIPLQAFAFFRRHKQTNWLYIE